MKKKLALLIIFLIPLNLGKHFVFNFSYVNGLLVDYLIPTIYVQDILIAAFLGMSFKGLLLNIRKAFFSNWTGRLLVLFLIAVGLSTVSSINTYVSLYYFVRQILYILFGLQVGMSLDLVKEWKSLLFIFSTSVLFLSVLAVLQFITQGSVFDDYLFFGEQPYSFSTFGIVRESLGGKTVIPVYGLFRHPNIFGGYLSIVLVWILFSIKFFTDKNLKRFLLITLILGTVSLLLTFSLISITVFILGGAAWLMLDYFNFRWTLVLVLLSFLFAGWFSLYFISTKQDSPSASFSRRAVLHNASLDLFSTTPLYGVGLGTSPSLLADSVSYFDEFKYPQPVHNIFILILTETGLFSILWFSLFVFSFLFKRERGFFFLRISFVQFMILGLFDHYLFTIHQTSLLFWLTVGIYFGYTLKEHHVK